jgi:ATP-dependent RNA helicase DHX29
MALKHLRKHLATVLSLQFRSQPLTESQVLWKELAEMVLSKVKPAVEEKSSLGVRIA